MGALGAGLVVILTGFVFGLPRIGLVAAPWVMAAGAVMTGTVYLAGYVTLALARTSK